MEQQWEKALCCVQKHTANSSYLWHTSNRCHVICLLHGKLSTTVRSSKTIKLLFCVVHVKIHTANMFIVYLSKIHTAYIFAIPIFVVYILPCVCMRQCLCRVLWCLCRVHFAHNKVLFPVVKLRHFSMNPIRYHSSVTLWDGSFDYAGYHILGARLNEAPTTPIMPTWASVAFYTDANPRQVTLMRHTSCTPGWSR
jgi:hypothetical protein